MTANKIYNTLIITYIIMHLYSVIHMFAVTLLVIYTSWPAWDRTFTYMHVSDYGHAHLLYSKSQQWILDIVTELVPI